MNKKYVLKPWVKYAIGFIVIFILLLQLILINNKLNKLINKDDRTTVVLEMRCKDGQ